MTEKAAVATLVKMLRKGTTREELAAKAWELSIQVPTWCEPDQLVLTAEIAVS